MREPNLKVNIFTKRLLRATTSLGWGLMAAGGVTLAMVDQAAAFNVYQGDGWTINLSTQVQYSNAFRVNNPNQTVLNNLNTNNGDQNFQHGMIANQFEVVPVLSVSNGNFGLHVSGEAYINTSYLQQNQNETPNQLNYTVNNPKNFPTDTINLNGRNAELLDAFVYDSVAFGASDAQTITFKVGRQTLLWGQSLFYTNDGIAGGQAPVDVSTALTLANPQAQQIFMPVGQAVFTYQPNNWATLQGYYQFEWRRSQFPGSGSYFWNGGFVAPGGDRLLLAETPVGPYYLGRVNDVTPSSSNGQFGLSAQFQINNFDVGVYALRFDAKTPQIYLNVSPPTQAVLGPTGIYGGRYQLVYQKDIQVYGASFSTNVGPVNVAGELSGRRNQDLYSNAVQNTGYNENSNPGYAVGDILNGQLSAIYLTPGLPLMPGGMSIAAEMVANRVIAVTANKSALVSGRTANALGFEVTASPAYYNVLPNVDMNIPVGFTWTPTGRSEFDPALQAGTGSINIGVTATYKSVWKTGINYEDYLGSTSLIAPGVPKQALADRGYLSFYISRTF